MLRHAMTSVTTPSSLLLWSPRSVSLSAFCTSKRCFQIHPRIAAKSISSTSFKLQYYKSGAIKQPRLGIPSRGRRMSIKNPCQAAFRNRRPFARTDSSCDRMLMYGKEASNRKQEIDRQHYTIPNQRPKDKHCGKI